MEGQFQVPSIPHNTGLGPSLSRVGTRWNRYLLVLSILLPLAARAVETEIKDADGPTSWVYTPTEKPDPAKTYWLVVGVHGVGGNGRGACGVADWATAMDDVIVLGPSFAQMSREEYEKRNADQARPPGPPRDSYQMSGPVHEAKLKAQIAELGRHWDLHPKVFIHGFSAGAQFTHRFAFKNPEIVDAVSAHSAGSWASPEGDDRINPAARAIPFALSCGEADNGKMSPSSGFTRIEACRAFAADLLSCGFSVQLGTWPGVDHNQAPEAKALGRALLERLRKPVPLPAAE